MTAFCSSLSTKTPDLGIKSLSSLAPGYLTHAAQALMAPNNQSGS